MADFEPTKLVLRHTSGSKANSFDEWKMGGPVEIHIGRDPSNGLVYDNLADDSVSRKHATIRAADDSFLIEDRGSANGTFVNKKRITSPTELRHGDIVTLGPNGPSFLFQLDPPPAGQLARTRVIDVAPLNATRVANAATNAAGEVPPGTVFGEAATKTGVSATNTGEPPKTGVGRETMIREISQARSGANRQWAAVLIPVALLVAAGGGYLAWSLRQEAAHRQAAEVELARKAAQAAISTEQNIKDTMAEARKQQGLSPQDIVRQFGPATAQIDVQWRLYDQLTGRPIFLKVVETKDKKTYPLYVKDKDGRVTPWLTLDDENRFNRPIMQHIEGTAFVVSDHGHLLTNRHMAAGWRERFFDLSSEEDRIGVVISESSNKGGRWTFDVVDLSAAEYKSVRNWIPETGGRLYPSNSIRQVGPGSVPSPANYQQRDFIGRNDSITVRFANTQTSINASLVRSSDENDAALIKVDSPGALQSEKLSRRRPSSGERVVVLGFPAVGIHRFVLSGTIEGGTHQNKTEVVPIPYVTEGIVALSGEKIVSDSNRTMVSEYGDLIQLTINATGAGNSGGPVFDSAGEVVGIFSNRISAGQTQSSAAVPIEYGNELMKSQQ